MEKIFNADHYIDEYSRFSKAFAAWVQPTEVRSLVEKTIDLQVDGAKLFSKSVSDLFNKVSK